MTEKLISLEQEAPVNERQEKLIDVSPVVPPRLPQDTVNERALRYHYTLGEKSPGAEKIRTQINSLHEKQIRDQIALDRTLEEQQVRMDVLSSYMQARDAGKKLTPEDVSFVKNLMQPQPVSPDSIVEREYAEKVVDQITTMGDNPDMAEAYENDPDFTLDAVTVAQQNIAKTVLARKVWEDIDAKWNETGFGTKTLSFMEQFVPFLDWYRQTDVLKETDAIWQGAATQEQIDYLYSLPLEEFHTELKKGVVKMFDADPLSAFRFLDAVISYSSSDALWDTTFNAIDIASVVPVGTGLKVAKVVSFKNAIKKKAKELGVSEEVLTDAIKTRDKVKKSLKDIGIAASSKTNTPDEVLAASGRIEDSADIAAKQIIQDTISQRDPRGLFDELAKRTTSLLDVRKRLGINKERLADAHTLRLVETMERGANLGLGAVSRIPRVSRQTLEAETAGLEAAREQLKMRYPNLDDSVVYFNNIRATDQQTNQSTVEMVLGKNDASIFSSEEEARNWAKNQYKLVGGTYRIDKTGVGYTINIAKDVDETDVRSFLVTTDNQNPTNWFSNYVLNKFFLKSGAKEKVSLEQRADRALVTHAMTELTRVAQEMTESVGTLTKAESTALNTILDYNRHSVDPTTGDIGRYFGSLDEFQTETNRILGRAPTLRETQAYFTVVQLNDLEYILTNLTLHAHKTRQGIEMHRFDYMSDLMPEKVTLKFEGRLEPDGIPWDDGNRGGILEVTEDGKAHIYHRKETVGVDEKDRLNALVKDKGYKVVRIAAPDRNHFKQMGLEDDSPVNFALVKNHDTRPLRLTDHIPYKPGGHADYVDEHWVKQPMFVTKEDGAKIYKGDHAVFNFKTQAEAKKYQDAMSRAQFFLKNNMLKEFDDHVTRNLPFTPKELEIKFMGTVLDDGTIVKPVYDINVPFLPLRSGQRSVDEFNSLLKEHAGDNYEDLINSSYNMYQDLDKRHTGRRDPVAWTVENRGTELNPDHHLASAKMLDPLKSTYQSLSKTIRSQFYEDYQIKSVESFIEQYSDLLLDSQGRPGNKKHLYADMRSVLKEPKWREGADPQRLESAKHMRDAVVQMLGTQSFTANQIDGYMQRLANYAFSSGVGNRQLFGSKVQDWIPNNKMQYVTDPFKHMRAMAFHSKLGIFNPVTWFVQMQGMVPLMSIAGPQKAFKGGGAAFLHMQTSTAGTDSVIKGYAKKAEGFGWKESEWLDARTLLRNSGFDIIGGSHAYLDDMASPKIFQGKMGKALDAGAVFFRNSEGFIRNTAFFTAYEEALTSGAIRVGKVNNRQLASILNRAENLALNMTRNANSSWQQGMGSTLTQFWGYQTRTFELLWGRNLTKQEKARLFVGTSAVYGLPVGTSAAVMPVWPLQESIRQAAIENGNDPDSGFTGALLQGAPQLVLAMILGEDYNIAERWGPGGLEALKTAFEGDFKQAVLDLGMGASGSILGDIISDMYPMAKHAMYLSTEDDSTYGELLLEDLGRAARNISSVNNLMSLHTALSTGMYITKNDTIMGPLDTVDSILKSFTGLTPNHIQDMHLMNQSVMNRRDRVNTVYSSALPDMKRYQKAMRDGDMEAAEKYLKAVKSHFAVTGLRPDEEQQVIQRLFDNNLDTQGSIYTRFHDKGDIDPEKREAVQENIRDKLRELENR